MKVIARLLIALFIATLITGCSDSSSALDKMLSKVTHYAARVEGDRNWSLMTPNGSFVAEGKFGNAPTAVMENTFSTYEPDGITIWRLDGEEVTPMLTGLRYAGAMNGGRMPVTRRDTTIEVINGNGETVFNLAHLQGRSFNACGPVFTEGLLPIREGTSGLWGCVDTDGRLVIEPRYKYLSMFNCGHALALTIEGHLTIVDRSGGEKTLQGDEWIEAESGTFVAGHAIVRHRGGLLGVIDTKGSALNIDASCTPLALCQEGVLFTNAAGESGVMGFDGQVAIVPAHRRILADIPGSDMLLDCGKDGGLKVIDPEGKVKYTAPSDVTMAEPLFGATGFVATTTLLAPRMLLDAKMKPVEGLRLSGFERRLWLSDVVLSDRDSDHRIYNTADPGDEEPDWMKVAEAESPSIF